ncbi:DUF4876 domain-containing protein [Gynurincola endophyticus]|uniref:DUF4876 domain-containing protein n=1 Tax=Gynurincola endophyticus TaxID=2479004 RepID=UPI000F8DAEB9|nr:DUF4876 domain-containing protein [Gynurincola endophyticus]
MKKLVYLVASLMVALTACKKDTDISTSTVDFDVKVQFEEFDFPLNNIQVKIENEILGVNATQNTNAQGVASFRGVSLGLYKISASVVLSAEEYFQATGIEVGTEVVNFNGLLNNVNVSAVPGTTYDLKMDVGKVGDLVIKQLYYAGSHTSNAASFRDCFVEVYNNSNEVLYADSLYFSQVKGVASKFSTQDLSPGYFITDASHPLYKQFDWSKSLSNTTAMGNTAYENYIYVESAFMIPGSGTSHPIEPGESIIIAANAINHKAPYVKNNGEQQLVKDPALTIDLSGADWEVYYGDLRNGGAYDFDIDNPDVPNVVIFSIKHATDLIMDATGRDAFVIYKLPQVITSYPKWATPDVKVIDANTTLFYQIPIEYVLDGVQTLNPNPEATQRNARKLNNKIDAGPTWVTDGQYSSQSLMRKTAKVVNGRKVLQDSNNSAEDFVTMSLALPYGFAN